MTNTGDRKSVRAAEKAADILAAQRASVVRNLMSTVEGREWMWNLLATCHIFEPTIAFGAADVSAFREGERNIGLALLSTIMLNCADQFIQAQREANERRISDDRSTAAEQRSGEEPDGRDSGREADSGADTDEFGADLYAEPGPAGDHEA